VSLRDAPIGCVPILWNNVDLPDLGPEVPFREILDELRVLGFAGCQFGRGFPEGAALADELSSRDLRLAELYSALPATPQGLGDGAAELAARDLDRLVAAGGEVLVVALDGSPERDAISGRAIDGPRWPDAAFDDLARLLDDLARRAPEGRRVTFHPHTATWIEAPDEVASLASRLEATAASLCLDVGHYTVGGGDPVEAIRRYGNLVTHVHAKDVDGDVLRRLRAGELEGFGGAVRERLFTELGNGVLDLAGVLAALDEIGFDGWLMAEQDSSWLPPTAAAAVNGRILQYATAELDR